MEYVYQSVSIVVTRQTFKTTYIFLLVQFRCLKEKCVFSLFGLNSRQAGMCALMLLFILKRVTISDWNDIIIISLNESLFMIQK